MATNSASKGTAPARNPVVVQSGQTGDPTDEVRDALPADADAEAAWMAAKPEAEQLADDALEHPSVTVREAAILGMTVARRAHTPAERAEFQKLIAARLLDEGHYAKLSRYASALFFVRAQVERAPTESTVQVPTDVIDKGDEVRRRMLKVLGFYFDETTAVGAKLAKIRPGNGYADLSGDLITLATLYRDHRARIEHTPEFYFATDEAEARRIASDIVTHLSTTDDSPTWTDAQQRVWTLFRRAYDEVTVAGRYLFRRDPDVSERYPSLHTLNVAARQSAAKPAEPTPPAPDSDPKK